MNINSSDIEFILVNDSLLKRYNGKFQMKVNDKFAGKKNLYD